MAYGWSAATGRAIRMVPSMPIRLVAKNVSETRVATQVARHRGTARRRIRRARSCRTATNRATLGRMASKKKRSSRRSSRRTSRGGRSQRRASPPTSLLRLGSSESFKVPARAWKHFYAEALKEIAWAHKLADTPGWREENAGNIAAESVSKLLRQTPEEVAAGSIRYIEYRASFASPGGYPTNRPEYDLWVRLGGKVTPFRPRA